MTEPPRESDDLFTLRPEEFTAARNALVKRLKSEGQTDQAREVQALHRPTVGAWALNQLARQRPELVQRVIGAGDHLRKAMEKAMGGDRSEFQAAQTRERNSVQEAVEAASELMAATGGEPTETIRQRMADTLRAATVEGTVADLLRRGVLEADMSAPGFGLEGISAEVLTRQRPAGSDESSRRRERRAHRDELKRQADDARRRLGEALAAADEAEERAVRLRGEAEEAERDFQTAKKRLEEASKI
jgi:hypothetical protein